MRLDIFSHCQEQVSAWNKSSSKLTVSLEKLGEVEERKKQGAPSPFKKKSQRERRRETSQSKSENEDSNVVNKDPNVVNKEDQKECPWFVFYIKMINKVIDIQMVPFSTFLTFQLSEMDRPLFPYHLIYNLSTVSIKWSMKS